MFRKKKSNSLGGKLRIWKNFLFFRFEKKGNYMSNLLENIGMLGEKNFK